MFDNVWMRYATSGSLIAIYAAGAHLAHRRRPASPGLPSPLWVKLLTLASITGYYLLIKPTGGALLAGYGNYFGILLTGAAVLLRLGHSVRYPDLAGRALFYLGLPLAVGVPWGLLVLSLPAIAASVVVCRRADRGVKVAAGGRTVSRYRMLPGIW